MSPPAHPAATQPALPPRRERNPRGEGVRLRQQLLAAGAELLAESNGPEVLTLRAVARRVGVAPASIYHHFADIDVLVNTILAERFTALTRVTEVLVHTQTSNEARLVARCWAYVHWGLQFPGHYRVVFGDRAGSNGTLPDDERGDSLLNGLCHDLGAVTGSATTPRDGDIDDAHTAGVLLWTALHGLVSLLNDKFDMRWPEPALLVTRTISIHAGLDPSRVCEITRQLPSLTPPRPREAKTRQM